MMRKMKEIFRMLIKKLFLGYVRQTNSTYKIEAPKDQVIHYHMSSVFPDKQTKDVIMNNIYCGMLEENKDEKKDVKTDVRF